MILSQYALAGLVGLFGIGLALLMAAAFHPGAEKIEAPMAWSNYRFGYPVYALIFVSFDMEMIFMYPWGVVFADIGLKAFLDMFVFIALLSAGIAYTWGVGGFRWE